MLYHIILFLSTLFIPLLFGWWLFIPLLLIYLYLAHAQPQILVVAILLDRVYYFGSGLLGYRLSLITIFCLIVVILLEKRVHWSQKI